MEVILTVKRVLSVTTTFAETRHVIQVPTVFVGQRELPMPAEELAEVTPIVNQTFSAITVFVEIRPVQRIPIVSAEEQKQLPPLQRVHPNQQW